MKDSTKVDRMLYASNSLDNAPEIFREGHHASAAHQVDHTETNARSATVPGSERSVLQRSFERFFPTRPFARVTPVFDTRAGKSFKLFGVFCSIPPLPSHIEVHTGSVTVGSHPSGALELSRLLPARACHRTALQHGHSVWEKVSSSRTRMTELRDLGFTRRTRLLSVDAAQQKDTVVCCAAPPAHRQQTSSVEIYAEAIM
jgi:hypothetical protein